ncbi:MAG: NADH-quinone oxidoreductase subunit D [Myxococcota bacterium]
MTHAVFDALNPPPVADVHLDLESYDADADLMVLNLGPQHPSTHGVFRVKLVLDGEVIVKAVPYPGYLHRGVEKLLEKLTYAQQTPIVDKNDYLSPMINEQVLNMAFEAGLGIEVPRRARWLRTILAELQRLASHLVAIGTFVMDVGGSIGGGASMFMYTFRDRELILDLFEDLTGGRFHYNTHQVGGNRHDVPVGWDVSIRAACDQIERSLDEWDVMTVKNGVFRDRTIGVGVLSRDLALQLGASGPIMRASGIDLDLRRDAPYHLYNELDVQVATGTGGDCFTRYRLRAVECRESIRLIRILLEDVPEGPLCSLKPSKGPTAVKIKDGQWYVAVEGPRGEIGTYLIAGGNKGMSPYRLKIRPPSLHALATVPYLLPGHTLSDAVAILGSLDPIMGEVDR